MNVMETKGLIFNIQRYSIHDGHGIRTVVFFKGCPLQCPWCSNPESRGAVTPTTWIKNNQTETVGKWYTVSEVVDEVMRDEIFFRTSGGGITLSGGEVLMQPEFAASLLKELQNYGIDTAIETTGSFPLDVIKKVAPYLNHVLFDLKIMDATQAKQIIGTTTDRVTENFDYILKQKEIQLTPRVPLIPEYTDNDENIDDIIEFLHSRSLSTVHLLPFHQYGSNKYNYLSWNYQLKDTGTLTTENVELIKNKFEHSNIHAIVDGLD